LYGITTEEKFNTWIEKRKEKPFRGTEPIAFFEMKNNEAIEILLNLP
jgi:hypothetical protein